jgi:hypothetical protein
MIQNHRITEANLCHGLITKYQHNNPIKKRPILIIKNPRWRSFETILVNHDAGGKTSHNLPKYSSIEWAA